MKKKIIFQKCHFNYIYFLIYILAYIITLIIDNFLVIVDANKNESDNYFYYINREILELYSFNLADFIAIIPYLIRKKLSQSNNDNKKEEDNGHKEKKELIYNDSTISGAKIKPKKIFFFLILISAFDFLKDFTPIFYYFILDYQYDFIPFNHTVIFEIIIQFIFSYLILRIHFYKLQHFSLYLNVIIFIIILALDLVDILIKKNEIKGSIYLFLPFYLIFYCLKFVYGKKVILDGYISIYILILIKGVVKLIFVIIFSVIAFIINKKIFIIFGKYFSELRYILLIIGKIIGSFFRILTLWIIIERFSPNHLPLLIIVEEIFNFCVDLISKDSIFLGLGGHKYIRIVLYVISFIGVMLHNEIVVVNICGLASDTKYFYDNLVKSEEEYMKSDNLSILKRFETMEMIDYQDNDSLSNEIEKINNN